MCEYNFWDDRTTEANDSMFCSIIDDYCYNDFDCLRCKEYANFNTWLEELEKGKKEVM